jgi:hypothetical protein
MTDEEMALINSVFNEEKTIEPPSEGEPVAEGTPPEATGNPLPAEEAAIAAQAEGALPTEAPAEAEAVPPQPAEAPPVQPPVSPELLQMLNNMQENNRALYEEIQRGRQQTPQIQEPEAEELSEAERLIDFRIAKTIQPLKQENEQLKQLLAEQSRLAEQLRAAEERRATQTMIDGMKAKYPDFDVNKVGQAMLDFVQTKAVDLQSRGFPREEAMRQAEIIVREAWDTPAGVENLWKLLKAQEPAMQKMIAPPPANPPTKTPDEHLTPSSKAVPKKDLASRLESSDRDEQLAAVAEFFNS